MPKLPRDLSQYQLSEGGKSFLHTQPPVDGPIPYTLRNARRVLLELLDDVEDGGDSNPLRFFTWFFPPAPPWALREAAQGLRVRGLLEPYARDRI